MRRPRTSPEGWWLQPGGSSVSLSSLPTLLTWLPSSQVMQEEEEEEEEVEEEQEEEKKEEEEEEEENVSIYF